MPGSGGLQLHFLRPLTTLYIPTSYSIMTPSLQRFLGEGERIYEVRDASATSAMIGEEGRNKGGSGGRDSFGIVLSQRKKVIGW